MSTEARRASHPPRPAVPPRPAHPPKPNESPTDERDGQDAPEPSVPRGRTSGGAGLFDPREPVATDADGTGGPRGRASGAFERREPPAGNTGPSAPRPRTGDGTPPPPRASARFPDTPPTVGGETRSVPPQPTHRPTPPESPAETTTRLRPLRTRDAHTPPPGDTGERPPVTRETRGPGTPPPTDPPRPARRQSPGARPGTAAAGAAPAYPPADASRPARRPEAGRPWDGRPGTGDARGAGSPPPYAPTDVPGPARRPGADHRASDPRPGAGPAHGTPSGAGSGRVPDPAFSWSAPMAPGGASGAGRPVVSFGEPEGYGEGARPRPLGRRGRSQAIAAAACLVLGTGLIGGAVTGSWLTGDSDGPGARPGFAAAQDMWHDVPVDQLFPPTVQGKGAGPGGADRVWTRIAVAPDSDCDGAFDALMRKVLAPVGCERLLRATYTDATQSHVTTVGLLFTRADAAAMTTLARRFEKERLDRRSDLMPLPYAAKGTAAAGFGANQRASWTVSVLTDAPVVVYAVTGWADGRTVDTPQPAEDAMESGATTAPAQAGLGHEAQGLADRVERGLRKKAGTATEQPS
ncbi:hypothetical protein [Streptomyces edwardsiae]|uniref:Translation initiation factor IF-2 n=1 Tax=Streptomyces edwardsiae TaxID=3075527 RepID=A0ABU2QJX2_9ACTN|nr:hypothetical protein [Streptomyces sp. DSM 41635]MDT0404753.1 hypothetical protein [Streptomyces sp. DSM 41635]